MSAILKGTNLAVKFALELATLAAFAHCGATVSSGIAAVVLAIVAPLVAGALPNIEVLRLATQGTAESRRAGPVRPVAPSLRYRFFAVRLDRVPQDAQLLVDFPRREIGGQQHQGRRLASGQLLDCD